MVAQQVNMDLVWNYELFIYTPSLEKKKHVKSVIPSYIPRIMIRLCTVNNLSCTVVSVISSLEPERYAQPECKARSFPFSTTAVPGPPTRLQSTLSCVASGRTTSCPRGWGVHSRSLSRWLISCWSQSYPYVQWLISYWSQSCLCNMIQRLCLSSWFDLLLKTLNVIFKIPDVIDILFFSSILYRV